MKISRSSFLKTFDTTFWNKLDESIIPLQDKPIDKNEFLNLLYTQVSNFTYTPSHARGNILVNKKNGVTRFIPTFNRKDYCIFYFCIKLLENEIAINKVQDTFGGWPLGSQIKLLNEQEFIELEYAPFNSINELAWAQEWRSFQNIAQKYSESSEYNFFINLDIANFYDTINLAILERKIRNSVPNNKQDIVTLLFHFLQNWDKRIEDYDIKTVGLPQDEIGDFSRILANLYLQNYDLKMKTICDKFNSKYIRFADDQTIFTSDKETAKLILFEASKELFKINLNINSSKVKEFHSKEEFEKYWAFEIFDNLKNREKKERINKGVSMYFIQLDNGIQFRENSVLKRLLTINFDLIESNYKPRLIVKFLEPEFLVNLHLWHFRRIRIAINNDALFFETIDKMISTSLFNSFLFNVRSFYTEDRKDFDLTIIDRHIEELASKNRITTPRQKVY